MPQLVERRLAAILAADVAGYSRLMEADEEGTLARLRAHRQNLIDPKLREHRGRIFKTTGDGLLVEFASVVDAVRCAAEIQRGMLEREANEAEDRHIRWRIGVNLGDVIVEAGDIFGGGVNVAARLEALAEPGGICLSQIVRDQVSGRLPFIFDDLGEQSVKNIARPVRAYALNREAIAELPAVAIVELPRAGRRRMSRRLGLAVAGAALTIVIAAGGWWAWSSQHEPAGVVRLVARATPAPAMSIVVLPFENLSKDPDQEYFADGVTDDLTTDLSRISGSFVISRTTAFTYKDKAIDVRRIGRDLGVRYVLEGSVRRAGDHVHVNVQLIDAASESHVWADQFDTDRRDLAETQSEITGRLANTLHVALIRDASRRTTEVTAVDPDAQDLVLRGWNWFYETPSAKTQQQAQQAFARALPIDPRSIDARIGLAGALMQKWTIVGAPSEQDLTIVSKLLREALDRNPNRADAHARMGNFLGWQGRFSEARIELETALELDPNDAYAAGQLGSTLMFLGQPATAITEEEKALKLDPRGPGLWYTYMVLGVSHCFLGQLDDAVEWLTRSRNANPRNGYAYFNLAAALALKGDIAGGKATLEEGLKLKPGLNSLASWRARDTWEDVPAFVTLREKTLFTGLRRLGFPEK